MGVSGDTRTMSRPERSEGLMRFFVTGKYFYRASNDKIILRTWRVNDGRSLRHHGFALPTLRLWLP